MINKTLKEVWYLQKTFSQRSIKVCRFEIIDGVKYVYCIKHAYKFLLREHEGFAAVLWRLRQCVSCLLLCSIFYRMVQVLLLNTLKNTLASTNTFLIVTISTIAKIWRKKIISNLRPIISFETKIEAKLTFEAKSKILFVTKLWCQIWDQVNFVGDHANVTKPGLISVCQSTCIRLSTEIIL